MKRIICTMTITFVLCVFSGFSAQAETTHADLKSAMKQIEAESVGSGLEGLFKSLHKNVKHTMKNLTVSHKSDSGSLATFGAYLEEDSGSFRAGFGATIQF